MTTAVRIYIMEDKVSGEVLHMVKATSRAQAYRYVAREKMTAAPANGVEIVLFMEDGGKIEDATKALG